MQSQGGQIFGGQKLKINNLLSLKNKACNMTRNQTKSNFHLKNFAAIFLSLVMSSKLDINNFGNFNVSSKLDTGILHTARAATSTTTTMKLKDLPIGGVINLGAYNYVKIADNQFMQTEVAACPDGKTVAGKYVKCFEDSSTYTQTCTGSYYYNTSNTAWNSSTGKCDSSVTCPVGSTYCGSGTTWSSATNTCVIPCGEHSTQSGDSCVCDSGYVTSSYTTSYSTGSANGACSVATMQDWNDCSSLVTNTTTTLYDTASKKGYIVKKFADGNCYTYDDLSEGTTWDNAVTLCSNISGWSLPTETQFKSLISAVGAANMNRVWCNNNCTSDRNWWSATEYSYQDRMDYSYSLYFLHVSSSNSLVDSYGMSIYKDVSNRVRCIKN